MKSVLARLALLTTLIVALVASLVVAPSAQTTAPDILGEWEITTLSPLGENTNTVEIRKEGEVFKAMAKSPAGERPYDSIRVDGTNVTLVLTVDFQGSPMIITYSGTTDGKVMNGACDFGGLADGSWSAKRKEAEAK